MALFSQRKGLKPAEKALQLEGMDAELRNSLWTALSLNYFDDYESPQYGSFNSQLSQDVHQLMPSYWMSYFKYPLDTRPGFDESVKRIREFFFRCSWNEVYDFIEFTLKNGGKAQQKSFSQFCNHFLEIENSGYRFVGEEITPITSPTEINAIEHAIGSGLKSVETHLTSALSHLSNRKSPDYRNSIKESISAVESICCLMSGNNNATLGSALKVVSDKATVHPALEKAFGALYGYTSDEKGIRHALLEEQTSITFTDAKFMLVTCSAFVNYLVGKAADLGIKLG